MKSCACSIATLSLALLVSSATAQPPGGGFGGGPGGFGGGPGGMMGGQERKILKDYDKNGDGWLNAEERKAAREALKKDGGGGRRGGGFGGPGGGRGGEQPKPGPMVKPDEVKKYGPESLYDPTVLRTIFIDFEEKDWEQELEEFHGTDVDVAATVTVDGKAYKNVGLHFRGMSSYMGVRAGSKRSLNLAMDLADGKQKLHGYKTLNLLNNHEDATAMSTVLYSHIAGQYLPTPKANFVKVVINGESWGVYTNVQQFNKEFVKENFKEDKGARWKVRGSPGGQGGIEYLGDDPARYKRIYTIKSKDEDKSWQAFIKLAKTLNQTPPDQLEAALKPMLDVDGLLWFLALDVALINGDGFWTRASDYTLYLDEKGKFHFVPHDMNEAFHAAGGPGMGGPGMGGPGGGMRFAMPKPGEVLPQPLQDALDLTEAQKKELAKIQKETDDQLAKLLNEEQNKQLKEMKDGMNRMFGGPGGGGFGGGPPGGGFGGPGGGGGGGGIELDPLVGLTDTRKALRSKILAVPNLRAKYLADVKTIADKSLDWKALGPVVAGYRKLIENELKIDTKKLEPFEAFERTTADDATTSRGRETSLRSFADQRRKYLLAYEEKKSIPR